MGTARLRHLKFVVVPLLAATVVGAFATGGDASALGTPHWTEVTAPPLASNSNALYSVSCPTTTTCAAVGYGEDSTSHELPVTERWNGGEWTTSPVQTPVDGEYAILYGVSCTTAAACTAVGFYYSTKTVTLTATPLVEEWYGTNWRPSPTATIPGSVGAQFSDISCISTTSCMAVGAFEDAAAHVHPLAEIWNGNAWRLSATPTLPGLSGSFASVSCLSGFECTAVGTQLVSGVPQPLAEFWNGTRWSVETVPGPSSSLRNILSSVSCTSISDCTSVGEHTSTSNHSEPLAEQWDGSAWTIEAVPTPATGTAFSDLESVSCTSAAYCVATDEWQNTSGWFQTLADVWNGSTWTVSPTPTPTGTNSRLLGVTCVTSSTCEAVGTQRGNDALIERFAS